MARFGVRGLSAAPIHPACRPYRPTSIRLLAASLCARLAVCAHTRNRYSYYDKVGDNHDHNVFSNHFRTKN